MSNGVYDVRERTGNPEHASVTEVCERILARASDPRTDSPDAHLDAAMAAVVEQYGDAAIREIITRILVDEVSFRTAAADLDIPAIDGIRIGTTAAKTLRDLNSGSIE